MDDISEDGADAAPAAQAAKPKRTREEIEDNKSARLQQSLDFVAEIVRLRDDEGLRQATIARKVGRSRERVRQILDRHDKGIPPRPPGRPRTKPLDPLP